MVFVARKNSGDTFPNDDRTPAGYAEDLPPEFCRYQDEGCEFARFCLRCPYPECLHEIPGGRRRLLKQARNGHIRRLAVQGWEPSELAVLFGVSIRTVQRAMKQYSGSDARLFEMLETAEKGEHDA